MATLREASRKEFAAVVGDTGNFTFDSINAGSFQRIADACELLAKNHAALIEERDRYWKWYREERDRREKLDRQVIALRGVITRMKRQAAQANAIREGLEG